jgi:hypothetical protein
MTTPKGSGSVTNSQGDAPNHDQRTDVRRRLLAGGAAAAAIAVVGGRAASAAPSVLSDAELGLLKFAQRLELTARDLYDLAMESGLDDPLLEAMSEQHEAYAQGIAGLSGLSADSRNDDLFNELSDSFVGSGALQSAYDLESAAVATHIQLLDLISDADAAGLIASIISAESRHCVVLADVLGRGSELGATLGNDATPILP